MRNWRVFFENLAICVEGMRLLGTLREGLLLEFGLVVLALHGGEKLRPVVLVLHVGDRAAKGDPLAGLAFLRWVCQDIAGRDHNLSRVLWILIVFLNLYEVSHVLVS